MFNRMGTSLFTGIISARHANTRMKADTAVLQVAPQRVLFVPKAFGANTARDDAVRKHSS